MSRIMFPIDLEHKKLLIVRADNIGDLVCTTPLIESIQQKFPTAIIDVMLNTYNESVLYGNPNVREIISYEKAKHRKGNILSTYFKKYKFFRRLRKEKYDYALFAAGGFKEKEVNYVTIAGVKNRIGYFSNAAQERKLSHPIKETREIQDFHEVERVYNLGKVAFGLSAAPGHMKLYPDQQIVEKYKKEFQINLEDKPIGIHLSSRKPENRWSIESYVELIKKIHAQKLHRPILLFWAPGSEKNPAHPGDDEKAQYLINELSSMEGLRLIPLVTEQLSELFAGVSLCDSFICCDGGTMHIAASLVNRMVAIFGSTQSNHWHPWKVKYRLLQTPSKIAADISVDEVLDAFINL